MRTSAPVSPITCSALTRRGSPASKRAALTQ
jgi:hypothetical protein